MTSFDKYASEGERFGYEMFARAGLPTPQVLGWDAQAGILSLEDLRKTHESGRGRPERMVDMAADLHAAFWEDYEAFREIGLPWRLENRGNYRRHCKAMEKDYGIYRKTHKMDDGAFRQALAHLRKQMPEMLDTRFHTGKNITIRHGDLHPDNLLLPKGEDGRAVFIDLGGLCIGLGAEDLAMLLLLNVAPEKEQAMPLLERYHRRLCGRVSGYAFETLLDDYRVAMAEALFLPVQLHLQKGFDVSETLEKAARGWLSFQ
jgi:aminoglycoside/choline kinase family phosphotransferase